MSECSGFQRAPLVQVGGSEGWLTARLLQAPIRGSAPHHHREGRGGELSRSSLQRFCCLTAAGRPGGPAHCWILLLLPGKEEKLSSLLSPAEPTLKGELRVSAASAGWRIDKAAPSSALLIYHPSRAIVQLTENKLPAGAASTNSAADCQLKS